MPVLNRGLRARGANTMDTDSEWTRRTNGTNETPPHPAQWLPKPATRWMPQQGDRWRGTWSPERRGRATLGVMGRMGRESNAEASTSGVKAGQSLPMMTVAGEPSRKLLAKASSRGQS